MVAAALGACGSSELDTQKLDEEIQEGLTRQRPQLEGVRVTCPDRVKKQAGATFECPFTSRNGGGAVRVTQQDKQGNVRWQLREEDRGQ